MGKPGSGPAASRTGEPPAGRAAGASPAAPEKPSAKRARDEHFGGSGAPRGGRSHKRDRHAAGPGETTLALALQASAETAGASAAPEAAVLLGMTLMEAPAPMRPVQGGGASSGILEGDTSFGIPTNDAFDYYLLEPGDPASGVAPSARPLPAFFARPRLPAAALHAGQDRFMELTTKGYTAAAPAGNIRKVSAPAAGAERIAGESADRLAQAVAEARTRSAEGEAQEAALYVNLPPFNLRADSAAECYPIEGLLARDALEYALGYGAAELCPESREACVLAAPLSEEQAASLLRKARGLGEAGGRAADEAMGGPGGEVGASGADAGDADDAADAGDAGGADAPRDKAHPKRPGLAVPTKIDRGCFKANSIEDIASSLLSLMRCESAGDEGQVPGGSPATALFNIAVVAIACLRGSKFDAPESKTVRFLQKRFGAREFKGRIRVPNEGRLLNYVLAAIWHLTSFQSEVGRVAALLAMNDAVVARAYRCLGASFSAAGGESSAVLSIPFRPNMEGGGGRSRRRR